MRICLVASSFYPAVFYGGPISSTWDLSNVLAKKGIEVYVATTNANGTNRLKQVSTKQYEKSKENLFVRYYHEQLINRLSFSFIFGVWREIKKSDLVYIQYIFHYTVLFSLLYALLFRKKIILCPRGSFSSYTFSYQRRFWKKLWVRFLIKPFQKKIIWQASSSLEAEDILQWFPNAKVEIIPDGIDFEKFQRAPSVSKSELMQIYANQQIEEVSEILFAMGRLHPIKRFDVIIDAFNLYIKNHPKAVLFIAGSDDGCQLALEQQIQSLNLSASVFLLGLIDFNQKRELLSNVNVFLLASEFESFGIVVAEALACGTPVITSDKTPWHEIEKNNCGIFAKNNKEEFYQALLQIKTSRYSSQNAKDFVKSCFDWDVVVDRFLRVITND